MKNAFLALGLFFFATAVQAESEIVEFSFGFDDSIKTATLVIGDPSSFELSGKKREATCRFGSGFGGATAETTVNIDAGSGVSVLILPLERTDLGVKAFVSVNKQSIENYKWALINKDCSLPIGKTSSEGFGVVKTFSWGESEMLELSDGSAVVVTAN